MGPAEWRLREFANGPQKTLSAVPPTVSKESTLNLALQSGFYISLSFRARLFNSLPDFLILIRRRDNFIRATHANETLGRQSRG